jgi:hypothetical protein
MGCSNVTKVDSVTININILFDKAIDIDKVREFIQELDYKIESQTEGVKIISTDITGDNLNN